MKNTKVWIALLGAAALLCLGSIAWMRLSAQTGTRAEIYQNNILVRTVSLGEDTQFTLDAPGGGFNTVTVEDGRICVSQASCPDQVCVHQGWVSDSAVPIVCLPNQLVIQIKGGESDFDAATG